MKIDRRRFLTLALAMGASPGCIIREEPAENTSGAEVTAEVTTSSPNSGVAIRGVTPGCAEADPTGECIRWTDEPGGNRGPYAAADECIDWSPTGECIGWEPRDEQYAPANECIDWSPTGECIGWEPVVECIDWDPSGECIGWS
ncbi:MAG: hypothetical protein ACI9KE_003298 [Polyangiales bacterium]|jgi:hypothetical protein